MSGPVTSWRRSLKARALFNSLQLAAEHPSALRRLLIFLAIVTLLSALISLPLAAATPFTWWNAFRRCVSVSAALALLLLIAKDRRRLQAMGLGPWRRGWRMALFGVALSLVTAGVLQIIYLSAGVSIISIDPNRARIVRTVLGFLPGAVLVSVLEELIFRGYVLQQLLAYSQRIAVWGSSAAFAIVHYRPNLTWLQNGFEVFGLAMVGWLLAHSTLRTRQLYLAIGLHAGFAYWARTSKLFIETSPQPLTWLVGSTRLVNGVAAWVALIVVCWWICRPVDEAGRSAS